MENDLVEKEANGYIQIFHENSTKIISDNYKGGSDMDERDIKIVTDALTVWLKKPISAWVGLDFFVVFMEVLLFLLILYFLLKKRK